MFTEPSSCCIVYLASPKNRKIGCCDFSSKFDILEASLKITKKILPNIDIYIFHEDFTELEFSKLPVVKEYIKIDFTGYDDVFVKHVFSKGYILMCRFFSGIMQKYPQIMQYTHYMRLDDDSYFLEPMITESHITKILDNDYVYRSLFYDLKDHQSLFDFTINYVKTLEVTPLSQLYDSLKKINFLDANNNYTGLAPYNNFHISSIKLWNDPYVKNYIDMLESGNYILRNGWLDANIHAMIIYVIAPFSNLKIFHDGTFGYRHNKHLSPLNSTEILWKDELSFYPK